MRDEAEAGTNEPDEAIPDVNGMKFAELLKLADESLNTGLDFILAQNAKSVGYHGFNSI